MPHLSEKNFCDGLMKFTSPMGGIQQASASETAVENVRPTPGFYFHLVITSV